MFEPLQHLLPSEVYEKSVYYVRINSSALVLLGSFSSSIASILITAFMTLVSYPVARQLLKASQRPAQRDRELPTPYQLGFLITLLNGGIAAIWHWIKYMFSRNKAVGAVKISVFGLVSLRTCI